MRIGQLADEPVELKPGDIFTLTTQEVLGDAGRASVSFDRLPQVVKPKDALFLNDGIIPPCSFPPTAGSRPGASPGSGFRCGSWR
jgi:hypothetical protein